MNETTAIAAELGSVTHRYGARIALNDISVTVPSGCKVGLIGPDGVGKSTLQALIAGVRRIQTGRVVVLGSDMAHSKRRAEAGARLAYVPQGLGRSLYPTLSVYENVDFFGRLFGESKQERQWRIEELLRSTGLNAFVDRPAGKLSGGMQQKLALCCSLVHDPDLLILDEPTTGIDPLSRKRFWELIERIQARRPGLSMLTATAYMEEAERFDHLIAMDAGRIIANGTPSEIKAMTSCDSLEEAFIALLPEQKRSDYKRFERLRPTFHDDVPAIEADGLTMRFGDFVAVDNVKVRVERGEIFGFLGSNGCGKTTTMKMLTGLLQPTSGVARLFGKEVQAQDLELRKRIGYMSQSFSLYSELTVLQNLELHARLFHLPTKRIRSRIQEMLERFELARVADALPGGLPLGIRQRLQLAVAVIHAPEILILDEPTSGVDPVARDRFWELLVELSRRDGVTIFISTHYVAEAQRCDRISLMHAGRVLAVDRPEALQRARGVVSLEEAFIGYLEDATRAQGDTEVPTEVSALAPPAEQPASRARQRPIELRRLWAFARRESIELARDPIRMAFALVGPLILAVAMIFGISFDIEKVRYAALDQDQSHESRTLLENFSGSRYFEPVAPISSESQIDRGLVRDEFKVALVIPPRYGRDLLAGRRPELGVWLDGSNTFRAETMRGYVQGVTTNYLSELARIHSIGISAASFANIETRFRYNQAFLSRDAISPGILMMQLIMFSTMLTALGIVREKELGSITNFYSTPVNKLEFLIGKQLPYLAVATVTFGNLFAMIHFGFGVPMAGSFLTLASGAVLYGAAATAFGLVLSAFVRSQIAAIFASAIIVMIPALNFSGMMYPISSLEGAARVIGALFPALYFQKISSGVFNKGLTIDALWLNHATLAAFCFAFVAIAAVLLKKQEA